MSAEEAQKKTEAHDLPQAELGDGMHPALQKIVDNVKYIAIVAGAIVLIVGGFGIFEYVQKKNTQSSSMELGQILVSKQGADRVSELEAFVQQAPESLVLTARFELAAALQAEERYDDALKVWRQLESDVPDNMKAAVKLGMANVLEDSGKNEDALSALQAFLPAAPEAYKGEIQRRIAELAEKLGKFDVAVEAYRSMLEAENAPEQIKAFYRYKISNLEQQSNNS